jgi:hypothetical protein
MGEACGTHVLRGKYIQGLVGRLYGRRLFGRPRFDWRLILMWNLKSCNEKLWNGFMSLRIGTNAGLLSPR